MILRMSFMIAMLISYVCYGQDTNLGKTITKSPNAAALLRYVETPVGNYTGVPSINLPLYNVSYGPLSLPITLSYHAGGIKVSQESSQVGLGWVLNVGGVITREIKGIDDFSDYGYRNNALPELYGPDIYQDLKFKLGRRGHNITSALASSSQTHYRYDILGRTNIDFFTYLSSSGNYQLDYEPDVFSFNFNGVVGKFAISKNNTVIMKNPSNELSIVYDPVSIAFVIKTNNGDRYEFGQKELDNSGLTPVISSWYLTKIVAAEGHSIDLTYSKTFVSDLRYNDPSQSIKSYASNYGCAGPSNFNGSPPHYNSELVQLTNIEWPSGKVEFDYASREDMAFDRRLVKLKLKNKKTSLYEWSCEFNQDYFITTGGVNEFDNKRLRLTSITKKDGNETSQETYQFTYNSALMPSKNSYSRDYWGFNNNVANPNLIPGQIVLFHLGSVINTIPNTLNFANREPNAEASQVGMLTKIQFPTGGNESFVYESNDYDSGNSINIDNSSVIQTIKPVDKIAIMRIGDPIAYTQISVDNFLPTVEFKISSFEGLLDLSSNHPYNGVGLSQDCYVEIRNALTNVLFERLELGNSLSWTHTGGRRCETSRIFSMPEGEYNVSIYANGNSQFLHYLQANFKSFINEAEISKHRLLKGAGLRVKEILTFDPASMQTLFRKMFYNYEEDRNNDGVPEMYSYGKLLVPPVFNSRESNFNSYGTLVDPIPCTSLNFNSQNLYKATNELLGYDKVIVEFGHDSEYGKTVYEYENKPNALFSYQLDSEDFKGFESTDWENSGNGQLLRKTDYKKENGNYFKVKELENWYSTNYGRVLLSISKRDNPRVPPGGVMVNGSEAPRWFLSYYPAIQSEWNRLDSTINKDYQANGASFIRTSDEYLYAANNTAGNPIHYSVSLKKHKNSNNEIITTEYKYPANYPDDPIMNALVNQNQRGILVESKSVNISANRELQNVSTTFSSWNSNQLIKPLKTETTVSGASLEKSTTQFSSYDSFGNVLQYSRLHSPVTSCHYGHAGQYLTAEVKNAAINEIYHQNMEEPELGLDFEANLIYDNTMSHTGVYAGRLVNQGVSEVVSMSGKRININLSAPKKYTFSGWVYSNGPSADIHLFMLKAGSNEYYSYVEAVSTGVTNKWVYLVKEVMVPGDVATLHLRVDNNSAGDVWFDDLSIYPSDASMTTYTYKPLVGMTSMTDSKGMTTYYHYDAFGRLQFVKDQDGNVVKQNTYHYKN